MGGEVVAAVNDDVVAAKDPCGVGLLQPESVESDLDLGVYPTQCVEGAVDLCTPNVGGRMQQLSVQVGLVHGVGVYDG